MRYISLYIVSILLIAGCSKNNVVTSDQPGSNLYFPPIQGNEWQTTLPSQLGWHTDSIASLNNFLIQKNTKSFMILVDGKIVLESYFNGHSATATWEWNSAGKSLVSAVTGIAQQEGYLNINNKVSDYLGTGWTNMPLAKENLITVRNLLSMTSGINDSNQFIIQPNLTYVADAGSRWAYSNVFQRLIQVTEAASSKNFESYFNDKLKNKIGMDGFWNVGLIYTIYHSNTRSMARFGLLALNEGKWNNEQIINELYFKDCINSSQTINPSYGFLWWLNGKSRYMVPGSQFVFQTNLVPNAPSDMYAAMGAKDQRVYIIPSKKMVVVRMGEASDPANPNFALSGFDNALWAKLNAIIH